MFHRLLKPSLSNSFFLFGARGTGKTQLMKQLFANLDHKSFDLLDDKLTRSFKKNPSELKALLPKNKWDWVALDEVQRVPELLNVVHQMIEERGQFFALTGSSARKLKRGGGNLLAGRAFVYHLFPLTHVELGERFVLDEILCFGSLPKIFSYSDNSDRKRFLNSYVETYIREEIIFEQLVRQLDPFRDFLEISAQMSGKVVNHTRIAKDVGVDPKTVMTYFDILAETWMGFRLPAYHRSIRKAQRESPKFYWFDLGVKRALEGSLDFPPAPHTSVYGDLFEEFLVNEVIRLNHYTEKNYRLSYFNTLNSSAEIDLILQKGRGQEVILIEIKSATTIDELEVKKLAELKKEFPQAKAYYLSQATDAWNLHDVQCLHWQSGLKEIFCISAEDSL